MMDREEPITRFKLLPLSERDRQYFAEGSMELKRQSGSAQAQVWVVTPGDIRKLTKLFVGELCKDD